MTETPTPPDPKNQPDRPESADEPEPAPVTSDTSEVGHPPGGAQRQVTAPIGADQPAAAAGAGTDSPSSSGFTQPRPSFSEQPPSLSQPPPGFDPPPSGFAPPPRQAPPRLQRSSEERILAGVSGGLGRHFGVDPILFRVGFVALVFAAGTGVLLYIALAILMPGDDGQQIWQRGTGERSWTGRRTNGAPGPYQAPVPKGPRSPVPGVTLAVLLIGLGVVALVERYGDWSLDPSAYFAIAVAIVGVGLLVSAFGPWRRSKAGLIVLGVFLSFGLFVTSTVDDRGGFDRATFGEHNYRPIAADQIRDNYEVLMGASTLDLTGIQFDAADPAEIQITVTMGDFTILVPRDADVQLNGDAAFGSVSVFGDRDVIDGYYPGFGEATSAGDDEPEIILDLDVRFGNAEVHRVG